MFDVSGIERHGQSDSYGGDHRVFSAYTVAQMEISNLPHCPKIILCGWLHDWKPIY